MSYVLSCASSFDTFNIFSYLSKKKKNKGSAKNVAKMIQYFYDLTRIQQESVF